MWRIDAQLSLISLAVVPFMMFVMYLFADRIRRQSTIIQERESALLTQNQLTRGGTMLRFKFDDLAGNAAEAELARLQTRACARQPKELLPGSG